MELHWEILRDLRVLRGRQALKRVTEAKSPFFGADLLRKVNRTALKGDNF